MSTIIVYYERIVHMYKILLKYMSNILCVLEHRREPRTI